MFPSFRRQALRLASIGILTTLGGGAFVTILLTNLGCGDVVTYAKYSRQQGVDAMNAGRDDQAQGAFRDALRQNPADYQSSYYLGTLYAKGGRYNEAAAQFKTAMAVQQATYDGKRDAAFHTKLLQAYAAAVAKVDDHDATVNQLEDDAKISNTGDEAYTLAIIYAARGDADSAIAAYAKAADQAPKSFDIAKDQGLYLAQIGQKPAAEQALRRAYRLNQGDPQVNDGLRSLGIIPGPSLKDAKQMETPLVPVGPIPNYLDKLKKSSSDAPPPTPAAPAD